MDETVTKIAEILKRQHAAVKATLAAHPKDETVQALASANRELCAALSAALEEHGDAVGVSAPVTEASTAPKD